MKRIEPPIVGEPSGLSYDDKMQLTVFDALRKRLGIEIAAQPALDKQNVLRVRVTVLGHTISDDISAHALLKDPKIPPQHVLGCEVARVLEQALREAILREAIPAEDRST